MRTPLLVLTAVAALLGGHQSADVTAAAAPGVRPLQGNVGATVPELATRASDGLAEGVTVGRHVVRVPVWAAPGSARAVATLTANGRVIDEVETVPGAVVWLTGEVVFRPGRQAVCLDVGARQLRVFRHLTTG